MNCKLKHKFMSKQRKRERETLIRIAGTPTTSSSDEAKMMAEAANAALTKN
jgi:hypothetical protein